jgi:hypothetical protein
MGDRFKQDDYGRKSRVDPFNGRAGIMTLLATNHERQQSD